MVALHIALNIFYMQIFRTDLISAMKLPDHQNLSPENYMTISDSWRQEWERGVQVIMAKVGLVVRTAPLLLQVTYPVMMSAIPNATG